MEECHSKTMPVRLAGKVFQGAKGLGKWMKGDMDRGQLIGRLIPDAGMAALQGVMTPGDLGDKVIAGTTDFAASAGLGLVAARPFQSMPNVAGGMDMLGSTVGAFAAGPALSDSLQRGKDKVMGGQGLSAYERANLEYEEQIRAAIIQDLAARGLLKVNDNTGMM